MAGKFSPGDRVDVNGENAEIVSWPASNTGAFRYRTWGRGGAAMERTAFVSAAKIGQADKPISEGGGGQPVQQLVSASDIKLVQAAPPPPPPQPIDPAILREIEREDAEAAERKKVADEAAMAAMRAQVKAELLAELRAELDLAPSLEGLPFPFKPANKMPTFPTLGIDIEPEAVNREVHEGDVVATKPELVIEHEETIEPDEFDDEGAAVSFITTNPDDVAGATVAAPAQPWGRGRAARMHREVSQE